MDDGPGWVLAGWLAGSEPLLAANPARPPLQPTLLHRWTDPFASDQWEESTGLAGDGLEGRGASAPRQQRGRGENNHQRRRALSEDL